MKIASSKINFGLIFGLIWQKKVSPIASLWVILQFHHRKLHFPSCGKSTSGDSEVICLKYWPLNYFTYFSSFTDKRAISETQKKYLLDFEPQEGAIWPFGHVHMFGLEQNPSPQECLQIAIKKT